MISDVFQIEFGCLFLGIPALLHPGKQVLVFEEGHFGDLSIETSQSRSSVSFFGYLNLDILSLGLLTSWPLGWLGLCRITYVNNA